MLLFLLWMLTVDEGDTEVEFKSNVMELSEALVSAVGDGPGWSARVKAHDEVRGGNQHLPRLVGGNRIILCGGEERQA